MNNLSIGLMKTENPAKFWNANSLRQIYDLAGEEGFDLEQRHWNNVLIFLYFEKSNSNYYDTKIISPTGEGRGSKSVICFDTETENINFLRKNKVSDLVNMHILKSFRQNGKVNPGAIVTSNFYDFIKQEYIDRGFEVFDVQKS